MKIIITKNNTNQVTGWKILPESTDENKILATIRNVEFFSMGDDCPQYDGIETDESGNNIIALKYATKKAVAERKGGTSGK